jgi:hypothetical protein
MKRLQKFDCAIFIDDGLEKETILEDVIEARNETFAVSELLSREAIRRKTLYWLLKEKVLSALAKPHEE